MRNSSAVMHSVHSKFKASRWNIIYFEDNKCFAFNSLSCGFAELNKEAYSLLNKSAKSKNGYQTKPSDEPIINELIKGAFVVPTDLDEINLLKFACLKNRFSINSISLTIIPTYRCNFGCTYCFEEHSKTEIMSDEIQLEICKYVERRLKAKAGGLSVSWYGGEPLLAPKVIDRLS